MQCVLCMLAKSAFPGWPGVIDVLSAMALLGHDTVYIYRTWVLDQAKVAACNTLIKGLAGRLFPASLQTGPTFMSTHA